jgi:hypothetical protein
MKSIALTLALFGASAQAHWCPVTPDAASQPGAVRVLASARKNNEATPHPIARMHTEGTLPHQGIYDETVAAQRDFPIMRDAALAWSLTKEKRHLDQVDAFLRAWMTTYLPSFNPIDETKLEPVITAYVLTREALSAETRSATQAFLRSLAEGYAERIIAKRETAKVRKVTTWNNNWNSHRIKLMAMAAGALEDKGLLERVHALYLDQINNNFLPDGAVIDFEERDALHYVVYDLEPLSMAAIVAQSMGQQWLHDKAANGKNLAHALDWLVPYASGQRKHEEYVNTKVAFDRKRAEAGMPGFSGTWQPKSATTLYWQAARLAPNYRELAQSLGNAPDWLSLCAAPASK